MTKKRNKPKIPGAPTGQPGPQRQQKPERIIPATIDDDVDQIMQALLTIKRDWKALTSMLAELSKKDKESKNKK